MTLNYEKTLAFYQNLRAKIRFNVSFKSLSVSSHGGQRMGVDQTLSHVQKSA